MRLFANASYDFIGARKRAYTISVIGLLLSLAFALVWQVSRGSWLAYGVDFTGGTLVQVRIGEPTTVAELRPLIDARIPGSEITSFGEGNEFLVRTPRQEGDAASGPSETMIDLLQAEYGENFEIVRTEAVSAKVGNELQGRAALAILLSFAATLIYLAFRFEWRFGLAAVIATMHDVLLTIGLISVLRLEVALPTVAAVLTILGYSLNDTIIIFDRIRENLRNSHREDFVSILNRSINETLPRTVLTVSTTLVTLLALFLFGGSALRDFALIMIVGILLGTYSSIFVAAPALLAIERKWPGERGKVRSARPRASAPV